MPQGSIKDRTTSELRKLLGETNREIFQTRAQFLRREKTPTGTKYILPKRRKVTGERHLETLRANYIKELRRRGEFPED